MEAGSIHWIKQSTINLMMRKDLKDFRKRFNNKTQNTLTSTITNKQVAEQISKSGKGRLEFEFVPEVILGAFSLLRRNTFAT